MNQNNTINKLCEYMKEKDPSFNINFKKINKNKFTEKKKDGSTDLFSLTDFDSSVIRDTSSVYNAYKIGKLGAVPNLGDYYINLEDDEKDK